MSDNSFIELEPPTGSPNSWLHRLWLRLGGGKNNILYVPTFTVAGLPNATNYAGIIYVSDEVGGATLAFSDGTNWRRVQDRAIVS